VFEALSKYAEFSGRARRQEYWLFQLLYEILLGVAWVLDAMLYTGKMIPLILGLALFLPALAVQIRRLHDLDRTGWWAPLRFVPILGLLMLVFCMLKGTEGPNRFGPDPFGSQNSNDTDALTL
jgi:uncharacterized membrane protein YhaH (DUF805 family)